MKYQTYTLKYYGYEEKHRVFRKFSTLQKFINKIPNHELGLTACFLTKNGLIYKGQYFILAKGGLSVRF